MNGQKECFDIDLAMNFNPFKGAREYARFTNSGFVILDEERHIVRIVRTIETGKSTPLIYLNSVQKILMGI